MHRYSQPTVDKSLRKEALEVLSIKTGRYCLYINNHPKHDEAAAPENQEVSLVSS